jgi:hypothetical protein
LLNPWKEKVCFSIGSCPGSIFRRRFHFQPAKQNQLELRSGTR